MIASLALILLAQLLGELLARGAGVPIPGPVIGMGLMFGFLLLRDNARIGLPRYLPRPLTDGTLEIDGAGAADEPVADVRAGGRRGRRPAGPAAGAGHQARRRAGGLHGPLPAGDRPGVPRRRAPWWSGAGRTGSPDAMGGDFSLWVYLAKTPLLWLTVTLTAYVLADRIAAATGRHPIANPVLITVVLVGSVLAATGTPYPAYFEGAQFVHFLLGPATVVLAMPLYERRATVMRALVPMLAALAAGAATTLAVVIGWRGCSTSRSRSWSRSRRNR